MKTFREILEAIAEAKKAKKAGLDSFARAHKANQEYKGKDKEKRRKRMSSKNKNKNKYEEKAKKATTAE